MLGASSTQGLDKNCVAAMSEAREMKMYPKEDISTLNMEGRWVFCAIYRTTEKLER